MKTIVIAEAGVNHNGSIRIAEELVAKASEAGADFIKFQTFNTDKLVSRNAKQADYQSKNIGTVTSQFEMLKKLELSYEDHFELLKCCKKYNISFFSTAFDLESIDLLIELDLPIWKIPSGEITNYPYIKKIGLQKKPVLLSTGMATLGEVEDAVNLLDKSGTHRNNIIILHCTTEYPAPMQDINLRAMVTLGEAFKVRYGYSDHSEGIEIPLAAVAMGASVIEKHFTLDRNMTGPDHIASLQPEELKKMIEGIRNIEKALGDGIKTPATGEIKNKITARKSLVASEKIKKGDFFSEKNMTAKRPGDGLSPMLWEQMLGVKANKDYQKDEQIKQ